MVDISSQNNKINVTVSSSGNTANTNVTPDYALYYSEKSKEWAISNRIVDNTDYSSKYYANESKKQADISTTKATEVIASGNTAVSNIESARDNAITDVNTAGATQVALATEQATIATNKTSEVVASGNTALSNIDTAKDNAITSITTQETTSKNVLIDECATQIGLIQNEGATQVANVQSTGFYMRDDKLYFINSQGEETEFKSGSGLEICDIGMALYIDETKGLRRYLNGQIVDINTNTQAFLDRLKQIQTTNPDYFTTEDNWQAEALLNIDGCVYKFVLNYSGDSVVSVRLPKYPDYVEINAGGTLPVVGNGMTLGMTDGTTEIALAHSNYNFSHTFLSYNSGSTVGNTVGTTYNPTSRTIGVTTDSSKSGIQTTLKQTKLKMRYFIQVATGSETENNIINEIELNNPYSLFDSKYSDHELNNLSWLKSEGQWNAKAVYPTAYDKLLKVYNGTETIEGLSVKLSTETYTDCDFVLNTADETFRLPLKTKLASGKAVVGNGMTLGLTDGTNNFGLSSHNVVTSNGMPFDSTVYGKVVGSITSNTDVSTQKSVGLTTDPTKSGIETSDSGLYLYFYVGETVQNANLIDAGRIGEQLAGKQDVLEYKMVDSYVNGTSGYNVWKTPLGYYCEQWGRFGSSDGVDTTVTFLKTFKDTNYLPMVGQQYGNQGNGQFRTFNIYTIRTNSMIIHNTTNGWNTCIWQASGYLAEGEY